MLVVVILGVMAAAVTVGVWLAPKTYTATAELSATADPAATTSGDDLTALRRTLARLVRSPDVVAEVQERLAVDRTTEELRRALDAEAVAGTVVVQIRADDRDPQVAAAIANTAAQVLPLFDPAPEGTFQFTVSSRAQEPRTFASPDLLITGVVGLVVAVVVAGAGAVVRDRRRSTVDTPPVAEEATTAPMLAHVVPPRDPTALPALEPGTTDSDVFTHLRAAVEAESSTGPIEKVVVTGVTGAEVNIWIGANLAIALARDGRQVLLIDGRLGADAARRSSLEPDTPGLAEVLQGVDLPEALSAGPVPGLTVMPAGTWGATPAGPLLAEEFARVVTEARRRFDQVVVLGPPLDSSDDAHLMAAGGAMLLALPEGEVSVSSVRVHADRVRARGVRLLGVVLVSRRADRAA